MSARSAKKHKNRRTQSAAKSRTSKSTYSAHEFLLQDYPKTLFPLRTNQLLAQVGFKKLLEFAYKQIATSGEGSAKLYNHPWATPVTKAKVLEIPDMRFGLPELRDEQLREGKSDWLAWSAAAGSRTKKKASRNYVLNYFKNASSINKRIGELVSDFP